MSWLQDNQKDITGIGIILILSITMASARKKRARKTNQSPQNANPRLTIPVKSAEQLDRLFAAEDLLSKAGVRFDTGSNIKNRKPVTRDWELDYSLSGAKIKNPRSPGLPRGAKGRCPGCGKPVYKGGLFHYHRYWHEKCFKNSNPIFYQGGLS